MEAKEREQLHDLAESVFERVPELRSTLLKEVKRMGPAEKDVANRISSGRNSSQSSVGKALYEDAQTAQLALYHGTLNVIATPLEKLVQLAQEVAAPELKSAPASDVGVALAQLRAAGLGLDISKLFFGFALILLHGSVAGYIDTCEAYLGRPIGSHEARKRTLTVIKEAFGNAFETAPGLIFPPLAIPMAFAGTIAEAYKQIKAAPQRTDEKIELSTAAGIDRLDTLIAVATNRREQIPTMESCLSTCVNAVIEERKALSEGLRGVRHLQDRPSV